MHDVTDNKVAQNVTQNTNGSIRLGHVQVKHTATHTMTNSLSDMFHSFDDVDMDAFIDDMLRDDYEYVRGNVRNSVSDDSIDWIIANDINV